MQNYLNKRVDNQIKTDVGSSELEAIPILDFTRIPFMEIVDMLRFIGKHLVDELTKSGSLPGRRPPELAHLMLATPSFLSLRNTLAADPRSFLGLRKAPSKNTGLRRNLVVDEDFPALVTKLLEGGFPLDQFDRSLRQQILSKLAVTEYPLLPGMFWSLAGITAWTDLDFQYETSYAVRQFLRKQILIFPNDRTEPIFSPEVFWALIAQTGIALPNTSTLLSVDVEWLNAAVLSLRSIALQIALKSGWAGVWDCWLVTKSFNSWQPDTDEYRRQLQAVFPKSPEVSELFVPTVIPNDSTNEDLNVGESTQVTFPVQQSPSSIEIDLEQEANQDVQPIEPVEDKLPYHPREILDLPISEKRIAIDIPDLYPPDGDLHRKRQLSEDQRVGSPPGIREESLPEGPAGFIPSGSSTMPRYEKVEVLVNGAHLSAVRLTRKEPVRIMLKNKVNGQILSPLRFDCIVDPASAAWVGVKLESSGWTVYLKKQLPHDMEGYLKIQAADTHETEVIMVKLQLIGYK